MKKTWLPLTLAVLTGLLAALFITVPLRLPFVVFFAYVPLLFLFDREKSFWKLLLYSWIAMFVQTIISFQWVHFVSMEFGLLPYWAAVLILIGFSLFTNLTLQIFATLYYLCRRFACENKNLLFYLLILPSVFVISESLDPRIFNWNIGNALYPFKYLIQFADIFGAYGLSFFVFLVNVCVFLVIKHLLVHRRFSKNLLPPVSVIVLSLVFLYLYGFYSFKRTSEIQSRCPKIKAGVVQANIGNSVKLEVSRIIKLRSELGVKKSYPALALILKKYEVMTRKLLEENKDIDIIVWPETAFPGYYVRSNPYMIQHKKLVGSLNVPFIIGGYYSESGIGRRWRYYNSAILIKPNGDIGYYHKHILLPFGEYMPLGETFPKLKMLVPAVSDFSRGSGAATLDLVIDGHEIRFSPTICYEILKADYVRRMVKKDAHVFLNLTNDSWFGEVEPYQHLELSGMKAIEFRRPILRSTNTGVTALIDMNGEIVKKGGIYTEENFVFDVPICDHRMRTVFSVFGYLFVYFLVFGVLGLMICIRIKSRRAKKEEK